jgi:hypothetical protein
MTDETMLRHALAHARRGWPVFPCLPGQKAPATEHGFHDATTDPARISSWWTRRPDSNLAIATGAPGPDVLDVDIHPSGSGFKAFNRLQRAGLLKGARAYVRTPSGGLHAYFPGSSQRNGHLPSQHLDFRSTGGYIVAPPSQVNGKRYELVRQRTPMTCEGLDWAAASRLLEPPQPRHHESAAHPDDAARLARWVAQLQEGNRNAGLYWAARRAIEAGHPEALDAIADAAQSAGLAEPEVRRTVWSATRGTSRPFDQQAEAGR